MHAVKTLFRIKFLSGVRKSVLLKTCGKQIIGFQTSIFLVGVSICFLFLAFLIAMFLWPGFFSSPMLKGILSAIVERKTVFLNGLWILYFYFGLFYGANLVHELTISDNLSYLTLPLLYSDLVVLRMAESIISAVKFFAFFLIPSFLLIYFNQSIPLHFFPVFFVLLLLTYLSSFLAGAILLLALKKILKKTGSDKIFISFFIVSVSVFIVGLRLYKSFPESASFGIVLKLLNSTLGFLSFRNTLERTFFPGFITIPLSFLAVFAMAMIVLFLGILFYRILLHSYRKIHYFSDEGKIIQKPRKYLKLDRLYVLLRRIPADLRIILARDIITFFRRPHFLLKAIVFVLLMGAFFYNMESGAFFIPKTIFLYLLPSFVSFRLFIHSIGLERNNIFLIKQLTPSMRVYFMNRVKVNALVSFLIISPIWVICFLFTPKISFIQIAVRSILLISSLVASVFMLTGFSATFAIFDEDQVEHNSLGIASGAVLFYLFLGLSIPFFFYLIDILINSQITFADLSVLLLVSGSISLFSIIAFVYFGIRKLSTHL